MTRGQLPKAFLRIDPDIDQKHPDNLDGFLRLLCAANRQVPRGRFSSRAVLDRLFGKSVVDKLAKRGDIRTEPDGAITVPGWTTWQEGDFTVAERMRRYRAGKGGLDASHEPSPTVTEGVTDTVTEGVTLPSPTSEASRRQGVKASRRSSSEPRAHTREAEADPYDEVTAWLGQRGAWIRDGSTLSVDLARMVDRKGAAVVIEAMSRVDGAEDAAQFVYAARNALFPLNGSVVEKEPDPADVRAQLRQRAEAAGA